jgi:peptide/nickel transport system permease protein
VSTIQPGDRLVGSPADRAARGHAARRVVAHPLTRVVVSRLLWAIPLLFVVTVLSFLIVALTPGDAARQILGLKAEPGAYEHLRHTLGLDQPLYERYWDWLRHAVRGDFGASLFTGEPVTHALDQRLPVTACLIAGAILATMVIGVSLGVFSAVRGGAAGRFVDALALSGFALPSFWIGAALIAVFAVRVHWFPAVGYVPFAQSPKDWFLSLVLPVAALSLTTVAAVAKQTREAMLDALGSEYVRAAWASGVSPTSIVFRHTFRNASIAVLTILGLQVVGLLGGTVFVESVFGLPGLGGLAVRSATQHDLPMIQGVVVYFTIIVIFVNLVVDIAYTWVNPRVRAA